MEMNCERDYFYDKTTLGCLPCKDPCHPNRVETRAECLTHCKGYLQRIEGSQVTDDQWHHPPSPDNASNMWLIALVIGLIIVLLIAVIVGVITLQLRQPYRKGKTKQDYSEVTTQTSVAHTFLKYSPMLSNKGLSTKDSSSSHCQNDIASIQMLGKVVSSSTHSYTGCVERLSSSSQQETHFENDNKRTALKSAQAVDSVPATAVKQPIQTVVSLDLQEDGYDFVEQACVLPPEGNDDVIIVDNDIINRPMDRRNYNISASLQRLPWIRQFWWDTEGAKIVVDESHRNNGKELIQQVLALEGIPSQDFSFEIVDPSNLFRAVQ